MNSRRSLLRLLLLATFPLVPCSFLRADGGTLRLWERAGGYQVAVFTSPAPFRAGPVDVSVLVQDATTAGYLSDAQVTVRLTAHGQPAYTAELQATNEAATNKLFRAAKFELPRPGRWTVEVQVTGPRGPVRVVSEVEAAAVLPRWVQMWPWIGWPALAVLLFGMHQRLVRRKARLGVPPGRRLDRVADAT